MKKMLSLLLAVLMLTAIVVIPAMAEEATEMVPGELTKTIVASNGSFENFELGAKPDHTTSSIRVGSGWKHNLAYGGTEQNDGNYAKVVLNPDTTKGNPSGKVLAIHSDGTANGNAFFGFKAPALPAEQALSAGGVTYSFDLYNPLGKGFENGRMYFYTAKDEVGQLLSSNTNDTSGADHVIGHVTAGENFAILLNDGSSGGANYQIANGTPWFTSWQSFAINFKVNSDGTVTVSTFTKDVEETDWNLINSRTTVSALSTTAEYYGWSLSFGGAKTETTYYFDNFKMEVEGYSAVPSVACEDDAYSVFTTSPLKVTLQQYLANETDLASVKLLDSSATEVAIQKSIATVNGKQIITITPDDGEFIEDETYTVDFGGIKDVYGLTVQNVTFTAIADWLAYDPTLPLAAIYDVAADLNAGETGAVSLYS